MPVDIYLSELNGSIEDVINATVGAVAPVPITGDQTVVFHLPLEYMKQLFTITTDSYDEVMTSTNTPGFQCSSDTSDLKYHTKFDDKLHLNAAMATVLVPTKAPGMGADVVWYSKTDTLGYPNDCNVERDFVRYLAADRFKSCAMAGAFTNVNEILKDLYSKLEVVWTNPTDGDGQRETLFKGTAVQGVHTHLDNQESVCKSIYGQLMSAAQPRFSPLTGVVDEVGKLTFQMPFVDGDSLNYKINVLTTNDKVTGGAPSVLSRNYLVKLLIKEGISHTASNGELNAIAGLTNVFHNNIVGTVSVCGQVQHGLNYTPTTV